MSGSIGAAAWLHRLGNLALLAGIKNYKAQYFPFDRKKKIYAERNNRVSFDTTKPILSADHWTKDLLTVRQADLVDRAQRIWSVNA
ncbi:HNH endonuclease family protein [Paracoccus amoyensis]|uniref:HNH endonuclease family protein n=1 Tax=Paracoccus amoyensis TaxID=2760093 RepID=UPI001FE8F465|nr:HNH endonuclease family protein [Paracoccus amoyensis]